MKKFFILFIITAIGLTTYAQKKIGFIMSKPTASGYDIDLNSQGLKYNSKFNGVCTMTTTRDETSLTFSGRYKEKEFKWDRDILKINYPGPGLVNYLLSDWKKTKSVIMINTNETPNTIAFFFDVSADTWHGMQFDVLSIEYW